MSKYEMKNFQKKAYNDYLNTLRFVDYRQIIKDFAADPTNPELLLEASGNGTKSFRVQLDAPTGSGKTVMVGHFLKDFHQDYAIFVFTPGAGSLQEQTARRLSEIMGESNVQLIDDTTFSQEASTGIAYVGNWEKFVSRNKQTGDYKNRIVREGDTRNFFDTLIEIGNKGIPVLVLIDESHHGKGGAISSIRTFLNDIKEHLGYSPLYLEVSATPVLEGNVIPIKIPIAAVQKEGLIRKNVRLNSQGLLDAVDKLTPEQRASQQIEPFLIDYSMKLQAAIDAKYIEKEAYKIIDGNKVYYHSLVAIQIPNGPLGNEALGRIESYLRDNYDITRANDKLVVYLSDDNDKTLKKDLLDNIASPDSPVQFLIYKQGIATGWDCPRAQILVGFRHITSKIFTTQNLGRFVRTTEQKHYDDELLDNTYVISNVGDLGQASFGDDVDTNFTYEKESVLRVSDDGHTAMSSFNNKKIEKTHYASVNQNRVIPGNLKNKWLASAADAELWRSLVYSNTASLSDNRLAEITYDIEGNIISMDGMSANLASDNDKQYRDFETMVYNTIVSKGRNYGANAQVARTLTRIIIRWYRELVWGFPDANSIHVGKRKDILNILEGEKADGIRHGSIDENDFAVEQLSLDPKHWSAVELVINKTLDAIPSNELMTDEQFRETGSPIVERKLEEEGNFIISVTEPTWIAAIEENKVGTKDIGVASLYAYHIHGDEQAAYRAGGALLSSPEISFEKNAVASLAVESKEGKKLSSYMKSPENNSKSLRFGVETLDKKKVSDFYPDYLGELYNSSNKSYEPFIIEVKSEDDVTSANGNVGSLLIAKAKHLVDIANKHDIKAGVAYEKNMGEAGKEWVIITSVSEDGKISTQNLKEYMFS